MAKKSEKYHLRKVEVPNSCHNCRKETSPTECPIPNPQWVDFVGYELIDSEVICDAWEE